MVSLKAAQMAPSVTSTLLLAVEAVALLALGRAATGTVHFPSWVAKVGLGSIGRIRTSTTLAVAAVVWKLARPPPIPTSLGTVALVAEQLAPS